MCVVDRDAAHRARVFGLGDMAVGHAGRLHPACCSGDGWCACRARHDGAVLRRTAKQFDKPLGAFQAIAHGLADAVTTVDGGDTLVHQAAWARAAGRPVDRLAPMAKLFACRTYRDVTALAQQVFGGIGFTLEVDVQLHFRRAKQLQLSWWDTRYLEELVASAVLASRA